MNTAIKISYIWGIVVTDIALLAAAILKPEWWGAFFVIAALNGWGLGVRMEKWESEGK